MTILRLFIIIFLMTCCKNLLAQNLPIDSIALKIWPSLGPSSISKDGNFVIYQIENVPVSKVTLVVQSTDGKWKKELVGVGFYSAHILDDSKCLVFNKGKDSVGVMYLGTNNIRYIQQVSTFQIIHSLKGELLCYSSLIDQSVLVMKHLKNNTEIVYKDVVNWKFSNNGRTLVLQTLSKEKPLLTSLNWIDFNNDRNIKIWEGSESVNIVFDDNHNQLAFNADDSIWFFKPSMKMARCIKTGFSDKKNKFKLDRLSHFNHDGTQLLFYLKTTNELTSVTSTVEVWSYSDTKLQSQQKRESANYSFLNIINLQNHQVNRLQRENDSELSFPKSKYAQDSIALSYEVGQLGCTEIWNSASKPTWNLVFTNSGKKIPLSSIGPTFSLFGKYLLYFDNEQQDYFSYELKTKIVRNLTKNLNVSWSDRIKDDTPTGPSCRGFYDAVWLQNDDAVLVYDKFDIWKLDPLNKKKPINLTNEYGKKNNVVFHFGLLDYANNGVVKNDTIILNAFNLNNKNNGFFLKQLSELGDPVLLTMEPYLYNSKSTYVPDDASDFDPIKAEKGHVYIVKRRSTKDAPNYYSTKDFRNFKRLSNLQPQQIYNWYSSELHNWRSFNGQDLQGVLYKPKDFDPLKKYPVIFYYYERKSDGLNAYIKPEILCGGCSIDIPTYVSNEYLVFCPDIFYKVGDPMQAVYDSIVSAGIYISTLPYVDLKKMGIQGCSFGGTETNYLVTHTNIFSAAVSSSSMSNFISSYGGIVGAGGSTQDFFELGQARMGGSLWEQPDKYIKNSSIFHVNNVTTPILIMHTKNDDICLYPDALQFFTGLRRMGKKAWMLVYSEGNHALFGNEAKDFSIRMMQFFDHYLKDKPAPLWMIDSTPISRRGLDDGLALDTAGRVPGLGLLTVEEQKKVDATMNRKPIIITLK